MTTSVITRPDLLRSYQSVEFATLSRDGSPVTWPLLSTFEDGGVVVSTGYVFPTKALNAKRNPKVAALFSDVTPKVTPDDSPYVLVQGNATVLDQDLQANTERFMDAMVHAPITPAYYRLLARIPGLMNGYVGYMTRIYVELSPVGERTWPRGGRAPLMHAARPASFTPADGYRLPDHVSTWLPRYPDPPILTVVDENGYPAAQRVVATLETTRIDLDAAVEAEPGAPACLLYHRTTPSMLQNDAFLVRGHLDGQGALIPERLVGWQGTDDDRGVGSNKAKALMKAWNSQLRERLAAEGRPVPKVRLPRRG